MVYIQIYIIKDHIIRVSGRGESEMEKENYIFQDQIFRRAYLIIIHLFNLLIIKILKISKIRKILIPHKTIYHLRIHLILALKIQSWLKIHLRIALISPQWNLIQIIPEEDIKLWTKLIFSNMILWIDFKILKINKINKVLIVYIKVLKLYTILVNKL